MAKSPKSAPRSPSAKCLSSNAPDRWPHQDQSVEFFKRTPRAFDFSDPGCVSADTEYLTPTGWKRMDAYTPGDRVAQFHPETREIEFVVPLAYVKRPCDRMIAIAPTRGTSQRLSHEHRVLFYGPSGTHGVCSAQEYMDALHKYGPNHLQWKFATTFSVRNTLGLGASDDELRLMVALIADAHFPGGTVRCVVRLKKQRKIDRLQMLLDKLAIVPKRRTCASTGFEVFTFDAPWQEKYFSIRWYQATQAQLEVIADELQYWDSAVDPRPSNGIRFSTFEKESADFAQYALSAAKHPTSLSVAERDREDRGRMVEYVAHARRNDSLVGPGRKSSVYEVPNLEGFKYCFEVPTSFLLLRHDGYIFATGNTGKTRAHLEAYAYDPDGRMLVLCPMTLMKAAWGEDIENFTPGLSYTLAYADSRAEAFEENSKIVICNVDGVKWIADQLKKNKKFLSQFSRVVIDESTVYKHPTSQRSKAARTVSKQFDMRYELSGTPNPNSVTELWHQALLLDEGKRLGTSYYHFRNQVQIAEQVGPMPNHLKWVDRPGIEAAVTQLLADITIRHRFEDVMTHVPPNHRNTKHYELRPKHRKLYDKFEKDAYMMLENGVGVTAVHKASLRNKLLQIASGAVYAASDEHGSGQYELLDTGRYELITDVAEQYRHSVVFFNWRHQKEQLEAQFKARELTFDVIDGSVPQKKRDEIVKRYQDGYLDTILLHPRTGAHGLTLTRGEATLFSSPFYEADLLQQAIRRIVRGTQDKVTNTVFFEAKDTVEQNVFERLLDKEGRMLDFLEIMRERSKDK